MASSVPGPSADPAPSVPGPSADPAAPPPPPPPQGPQIRLQSSDGEIITVGVKAAKVSKVIKEMLENQEKEKSVDAEKGASGNDPIPITNVPGKILRKVLVWAEHHQDEVPPPARVRDANGELIPEMNDEKIEISDWDAEFLKVGRGTLFDLVLASNYLDMQGLLRMGCKAIANLMTGKSAKEMREVLNLTDDLTPAQKKQIEDENSWAERATPKDKDKKLVQL